MPALGPVIGFSDPQQQALGNWVEIPEGETIKQAQAKYFMPRHYSDNKGLLAGDVNGILVAALHKAFSANDSKVIITPKHKHEENEALRMWRKMVEEIETDWFPDSWLQGNDAIDQPTTG